MKKERSSLSFFITCSGQSARYGKTAVRAAQQEDRSVLCRQSGIVLMIAVKRSCWTGIYWHPDQCDTQQIGAFRKTPVCGFCEFDLSCPDKERVRTGVLICKMGVKKV